VSLWVFIQVLFNVGIVFFAIAFWFKLTKSPKDDPRLSRGLQMLQSKISVCEDLNDRVDHLSQQAIRNLEQKSKDLQSQINLAQSVLQQIEVKIEKCLETAKLIREQIPHEEMIQQKNSLKYVQAAKMANQGRTVEEIVSKLNLSFAEVELIHKLNRKNLQFSEDHLPDWISREVTTTSDQNQKINHVVEETKTQDQKMKDLTARIKQVQFPRI